MKYKLKTQFQVIMYLVYDDQIASTSAREF